jgi:CRP-like cAMP-binding protein
MPYAGNFIALLEEDERRALEALGTERDVPRGRAVLGEMHVADRVIIVRGGHVKIVAASGEGREIVLGFCGPGALIGEQAVMDDMPHAAGAVALEDLRICVVAASAFRAYLAAHPRVALAVMTVVGARLRETNDSLARFSSADALGRVAARLVQLCDEHGDRGDGGDVRITLPLTQEDLAGWTGTSIEATGRALRQLRELGWITTARRCIVVHDHAALRARAV